MSSLNINYVYRYMREERIELERPDIQAHIVWTREEETDHFDTVVYLSGYSFKKKHAHANKQALRILYICEPLSVYPPHFARYFWKQFDAVLTWSKPLAASNGHMHYLPVINYDYPFAAGHGITTSLERPLPDPRSRRKAICQIVGDKYSPIIGQLYSERRRVARWFHNQGKLDLDVYGLPAMRVPNYRGAVRSKVDTFQQYRYALCFENLHHPVWSQGYVTEKIFDCLYADCLPIYLGAVDISDIVPADCFIDFRSFGELSELDAFLDQLTAEEWLTYIRNIRSFLANHDAPHRYSCHRLYEKTVELIHTPPSATSAAWPDGFFQMARPAEIAAWGLMTFGLRFQKLIHPCFHVLRRLGTWHNP